MSLILGDDGKIHAGTVVRKFSGTLLECDCGARPFRAIGSPAEAEKLGAERMCRNCWAEETLGKGTLERLNEGTGFAMPGEAS